MRYINTEKTIIKSWCDNLEEGALSQAKNLANLPFIFKHIALMPDAHQGFGMPIGGVIATSGVVIPNAIGLDIGCFTGDTKIKLVDGSNRSFEDLYKTGMKDFMIYSCNTNIIKSNYRTTDWAEKRYAVEKSKVLGGVKLTRYTDEIAIVTFRFWNYFEKEFFSEEIVKCTIDHMFLLENGEYREAKDLQYDDILSPIFNEEDLLKSIGRKKILSVKIIRLDAPIPVYDITVESNNHNFALSSGVFVHNCGMCAVKTSLTEIDKEALKKIMGEIRKVIPVGFNYPKTDKRIDSLFDKLEEEIKNV